MIMGGLKEDPNISFCFKSSPHFRVSDILTLALCDHNLHFGLVWKCFPSPCYSTSAYIRVRASNLLISCFEFIFINCSNYIMNKRSYLRRT